MQARGYKTQEVLAGSHINPDSLGDPAYWIDIEQCHVVVSNIIRLTGDKSIGLEIGRTSHITDTGIIGYLNEKTSPFVGKKDNTWEIEIKGRPNSVKCTFEVETRLADPTDTGRQGARSGAVRLRGLYPLFAS